MFSRFGLPYAKSIHIGFENIRYKQYCVSLLRTTTEKAVSSISIKIDCFPYASSGLVVNVISLSSVKIGCIYVFFSTILRTSYYLFVSYQVCILMKSYFLSVVKDIIRISFLLFFSIVQNEELVQNFTRLLLTAKPLL